jgi:hypothetical protein
MLWRSGEDVLAQLGDGYVLIAPTGVLRARFEPSAFSDEDDLWHTTFERVGDTLVERTTIDSPYGQRVQQDIVAAGLRSVDDEPTRRFVARALEADAAAGRERERIADERVKAIPSALDELGLGEELARAQRALAHRVRTWDDRRAAELLRTLDELAKSRPRPDVVTAFACACLHACFDLAVPPVPAAPAAAPTSALGLRLEDHARSLDTDAEDQDNVDAHGNAAALWKAAAAMRAAARLAG